MEPVELLGITSPHHGRALGDTQIGLFTSAISLAMISISALWR
jgi:hypothetical protein